MRQVLIFIILVLNPVLVLGQNIFLKKIVDTDISKDYSALQSIGLTTNDILFIDLLSYDTINKNITISDYVNNINHYRGLKDYQIIQNISAKPTIYENNFPDSLFVQYDYAKAREKASIEKKPMLIIFVSHLSLPVRDLQNSIIDNVFKDIHNKYIIAWLYVDITEKNGSANLKLQNKKYSSDIQPFSAIEFNDKPIKTFDGYSLSMIAKYRSFLTVADNIVNEVSVKPPLKQ